MNFEQEITLMLSSNNFLVFIETEEEERLEYILMYISQKLFRGKICIWNFIDGYINNPNYLGYGKRNPLETLDLISNNDNNNTKIFLLKDFYQFLSDLSIIRKIKNLCQWLKKNNKYVIISGTEKQTPNILKEYITHIKLPLPNKSEIEIEIERFLRISDKGNNGKIEKLCNTYKGFTINRIRKSISQIIVNDKLNTNIVEQVIKEKEKIIQQAGILEFYPNEQRISDVGGLKNLKRWLKIRLSAFTKKAYKYGLRNPRGIILVGIQGTGKSLSAKVIAKTWNISLLKLDVSKIFNSMLGESENKIQNIIKTCESMTPCVLWVDEIDKIFTKQININDSGTTNRVTNIFLTWLSEKTKKVFVVATANNLDKLPIEILRKGRFDEIFFVDLPNFKERIRIFKIHLKKVRPLTWKQYNIYYLSKISKKFSGAEIEQSIIDAMHFAFYKNREFSTRDIINSIKNVIPLAITEKNSVVKMREWGKSGIVKKA
uniref:Uncharacterized AAA domain-containing protein ycf46 n=1 Tax=Alsidium seaforthii TaxID=2007182 RepID=A0A1Z1MD05_9FLOR|nr:hypothetical protein [Bryothamnion seaforthii]ARW63833.1 hypothetical protein [Bryothamnion seaforthii]